MAEVRKHPEWRELLEWVKLWDYGEDHGHEEVGDILGIPYVKGSDNSRYYSQVQRCNKDLLVHHQKYLKVIPKQGYRVIHSNEHLKESSHITQLGIRKMEHGYKVAAYTNRRMLTENENRALADYTARFSKLRQLVGEEVRELNIQAGVTRPSTPKVLKA